VEEDTVYAILELGGKQYKVAADDIIEVNKLETAEDKGVTFEKVLLVADGKKVKIGQPYVSGASVEAEVLGQKKGEKIVVFKYHRRKDSHKKTGHRQSLTQLKIKKING